MLSSRLLKKFRHRGMFALLDKGYVLLETTYVMFVRTASRSLACSAVGRCHCRYKGVYNAGQVPLSFTSATDRSEFSPKSSFLWGTGLTQAKRVATQA